MFSTLLFSFKSQRVSTVFLLAAALVFTGSQLVVAQEEQMLPTPDLQSQDPQAPKFDLNASVTDGLQLSRQGLNSNSAKDAPVEQALPAPQPTAVAAAMPPIPGAEGAFSAPRGGQGGQSDQGASGALKSGTSLTEFGVDWSTWMSQVADRWYFQLRRMEAQSPYEFYTDGPAQIEFTCYPNGQVSNVILRRSCGVPMYDRMQIEALLSTVPMPPFPRGTQRSSYTLCQGWEAHARHLGEGDYQPGSFGHDTPMERVQKWD
jgi:outer membrane biosynthesis protein TonB